MDDIACAYPHMPPHDVEVRRRLGGSYVITVWTTECDFVGGPPSDPSAVAIKIDVPDLLTLRCVLMTLSKGEADAL
jgi:hypothetical protein